MCLFSAADYIGGRAKNLEQNACSANFFVAIIATRRSSPALQASSAGLRRDEACPVKRGEASATQAGVPPVPSHRRPARSVPRKRSGIGPTATNHGLPPSRPSAFAAEVQRAASRALGSATLGFADFVSTSSSQESRRSQQLMACETLVAPCRLFLSNTLTCSRGNARFSAKRQDNPVTEGALLHGD